MKSRHLFFSKLKAVYFHLACHKNWSIVYNLQTTEIMLFKHISKSRGKLDWKLIVTYYLVKLVTIVNAKTKQDSYLTTPEQWIFLRSDSCKYSEK